MSSDGTTAIVGAPTDGTQGAAYVYTRVGVTWTQQAKLVPADASGSPNFGTSVAISADGNTALIGGPFDTTFTGAAFVFTRSGTTWSEQGSKLVGTGSVGAAQQGLSVALSSDGNTALVGGSRDNTSVGAAWVYTRTGTAWTQQGSKIVGTGFTGTSMQGASVALSGDGNTAALGGSNDGTAGAVWTFARSSGVWSQQAKLVGSGASSINGQGSSVALSNDGNTLVEGGPFDNTSNAGAAWAFTRSSGTWSQFGAGPFTVTGSSASSQFGYAVAINSAGNLVLVGGNNDTAGAGATWVFARGASSFTQAGAKLVGASASGAAQQGAAVALSADGLTAFVGAPFDNAQTGANWPFSLPRLSVSAPGSATAGVSAAFTVTAQDAAGSTLTGYNGTVQFSSTDGAALLPGASALTNGAGVFASTFRTAGSQTLTATDTTLSAIGGTSGNVTVSATGVAITFASAVTGLTFTVDGTTYTTRQTLTLTSGSTHTIGVTSPQSLVAGTQYVFSQWSDGGAQSHSITVPLSATTYTVSFNPQYLLSIGANPATLGTVSPSAPTYYPAGTVVNIAETPVGNSAFTGWSGPVGSASANTATVTMNAPATVTANFKTTNPIGVSPTNAALSYNQGTTPTTGTVAFGVTSASNANFTVSGPSWISIGGGTSPTNVTATVNYAALPVGTTTGTVAFVGPDNSVSATVVVTVNPKPTLSLSSPSMFTILAGGASQTQTLSLTASPFNATFGVSSSASWLGVSASSGITPASITLTANPAGLSGGTYNATVTVTGTNTTNSPLSVGVTMVVNAVSGASNDASGSGSAAPNSIVDLYGNYTCSGTLSVTVNGQPASILYSSATQVGIVVPQGVTGSTASIQVTCSTSGTIGTASMPLAAAAPAVYTATNNGMGQALALNQDDSLNGAGSGAAPGSYLSFFGTGFGALNPPSSDGLQRLALPVTASVGGVTASVYYAGEVPGFTAGLQEIIIQIPSNAPTGVSVPVVITVGGISIQGGVTIAVK